MSSSKIHSRVFLSHTKLDKSFARQLAYDLKEAGVEVWLDEWEIRVGDSLREKIESGIQESGWLVVILSPRAVESQWVQREISAAFTRELDSKRVFILPVLIDKCEIPILLRDKKYANFTRNYVEGLQELLGAVLPSQGGSTAPFGKLIDVNAHLWMEHFEPDLPAAIKRAREAGVSKIVASACNGPYSWSRSLELAARLGRSGLLGESRPSGYLANAGVCNICITSELQVFGGDLRPLAHDKCGPEEDNYSYRSATIGSMRVARLAGIKHAASATVSNTIDTPMNVHGSVALKP